MIEILIYAPGLRSEEKLMQFHHQTDMLAARCKVDAAHDMAYLEIDDPAKVSLKQFTSLFENIGLVPRLVGQIPPEIRPGDTTERLV